MAEKTKNSVKKTTSKKVNADVKSVSKTTSNKKDYLNFKHTGEIEVADKLIDKVIGQENALQIIRIAAAQRRHVL